MKILYLIHEIPLTPDGFGGSSALFYSHLSLLAAAGHQVVLGLLSTPASRGAFDEYCARCAEEWEQVQGWTSGIERLEMVPYPRHASRRAAVRRAWSNPASFVDSSIHTENAQALKRLHDALHPDLVLAGAAQAALLCHAAALSEKLVYLHLDWRFRIKKLRAGAAAGVKSRFGFWQMRRAETAVVRAARACLCASATEAHEARELGARLVGYCPTSYQPVELPAAEASPPPRLIHLGGMNTTATHQGLERFFEVVWPRLQKLMPRCPELWVIGDTTAASPSLRRHLEQAGVVRAGFVGDLGEVLRPHDIHIVPWEHATGTRTRVAIALNYAQAVVMPRLAATPSPELQDGENCVLVPALEDMAPAIRALCEDAARRKSVGAAARATFLRYFTREAQQAPFQEFLEACLAGRSDKQLWSCAAPLEQEAA